MYQFILSCLKSTCSLPNQSNSEVVPPLSREKPIEEQFSLSTPRKRGEQSAHTFSNLPTTSMKAQCKVFRVYLNIDGCIYWKGPINLRKPIQFDVHHVIEGQLESASR